MNLVEILVELAKPMESDQSSDESDAWEECNQQIKQKPHGIEVFINPLDDGAVTAEDSGDGDNVEMSNLPGNQLFSEASTSKPRGAKQGLESYSRSCPKNKKDIEPSYPYKPSVSNAPRSPLEIFHFFYDKVIQLSCKNK